MFFKNHIRRTYLERVIENMHDSENIPSENLDENLEDILLTVKEAAKYVDESPGVIRNWMRELKTHIPTIQGDNWLSLFR